MYITIDDENVVPRRFAVCNFYGAETCFCWDDDRLVIFTYTKESSTRTRILLTPAPVRKVQFFDSRAFVICAPQGAYKLSRSGEFAVLSKNALDMGGEFFQVLSAWNNAVYLDNKQDKSSTPLFPLAANAATVCTYPLNPASIEPQLASCLAAGWKTEGNFCIVAHHRWLYALRNDAVQLIYTSDVAFVNILLVKRQDKTAGLLLLTEHTHDVILVYGRDDDKLAFERIHLRNSVKDRAVLCVAFSLRAENILWLICCDQFKTYYLRKELFVDAVQEARVEERSFTCMQYYKPNIILGLLRGRELVELSLEELEDSLSIDNNIVLHTEMFERTDIIMEKICAKAKELNALYESLTDEQDMLKRINWYANKQKVQINPCIQVSRLFKHCYLSLNIPDKLPKNSYVVFTFISKNRSTFCVKKTAEMAVTIKMPVNNNRILRSSSINMDLITLIKEQHPWCLIQNFVNFPQDLKRKREKPKKDKTAFINAKIKSLKDLIVGKKELNMAKLCEIKKSIRAEL